MENFSGYATDNQHRNHCYEQAVANPEQTIAIDERVEELLASLEAHAGKEQRYAYLANHQVGTLRCVARQADFMSEGTRKNTKKIQKNSCRFRLPVL